MVRVVIRPWLVSMSRAAMGTSDQGSASSAANSESYRKLGSLPASPQVSGVMARVSDKTQCRLVVFAVRTNSAPRWWRYSAPRWWRYSAWARWVWSASYDDVGVMPRCCPGTLLVAVSPDGEVGIVRGLRGRP